MQRPLHTINLFPQSLVLLPVKTLILESPDVDFCGYSIPHPSDPKMNLRIQTLDDVHVHDVLEKGLRDLADLCDVVLEKFEVARAENPNRSSSP